ncbi:MAG: hypothetical protein Q9165_007525 [Trypethelium subeluteriae]
MPLSFSSLCDLLTQLEKIEDQLPPPTALRRQRLKNDKVRQWFKHHRHEIDQTSPEALLSSLMPHRRPDRNYAMQETRLERAIGRCYCLGLAKVKDLQSYKISGRGDLGSSVERATRDLGPPAIPPVSVEEVDSSLGELASRSRFSNYNVRQTASTADLDEPLGWLYLRMDPWQAKWLTRIVSKDIARFMPEDHQVQSAYHFLLPDLLRFQDSLPDALGLLKNGLECYPAVADPDQRLIYKREASARLCPKVGVKVGRPSFVKARSIQNCLNLMGRRRWSAERKYDGEYCEIHIDTSNESRPIQIYSKSGKDSTEDRSAIHGTIRESLRLGKPECPIRSKCILLGELLLYNDATEEILEFAKIRNHVLRSGRFIGTENDSPPHRDEHLMIMYHDLLMIDDETVMNEPYQERRGRLFSIIVKRPGYAMTAQRKYIDFSTADAKERLMEYFAWSITQRWEGLVLKPTDAPYFALYESEDTSGFRGFVKMKKDYIDSMGDEADFAVVGASYNARDVEACGLSKPRWTSFYLGCLENKDDVLGRGARPRFKVVDLICCKECIPKADLETLCNHGYFSEHPFHKDEAPETFDISIGDSVPPMQTAFSSPLVVEVLGSAFDKPSGANFYALRHPRIRKVHLDRSWRDTISFDELQELARKARELADEGESQELEKWVNVVRKTFTESRSTRSRSARLTATPPVLRTRQASETTEGTTQTSSSDSSSKQSEPRKPKSNVKSVVDIFVSSRPQQIKPTPALPSSVFDLSCVNENLQLPAFRDTQKVQSMSSPSGPAKPHQRSVNISRITIKPAKRTYDNLNEPDEPSLIGGHIAAKKVKITSNPDGGQFNLVDRGSRTILQAQEPLADITNSPDHRQDSPDMRRLLTETTDSEQSPGSSTVVSITPQMQNKALSGERDQMTISSPSQIQGKRISLATVYATSSGVRHSPKPTHLALTVLRPTFNRCIIYLAPCIARSPWIAEDLIATHGASRVQSLDHWVRERGFDADPTDDSVVNESQSYAGLQKVVLLETRREKASLKVVQEVLGLELRETVMFLDWRVLEEEVHETTNEGKDDANIGKYLFGTVDWDGKEKCHYFANGKGAWQRISR